MAAETAQRLTDAVLLAIREHGYAGTSMQTLLRDTGVSSSSMYHFFPGGKEKLVAAAVRASGFDAAERIAGVFERHDPAEGIGRIFAAAAAEMERHDYVLGCPIGVPATPAYEGSVTVARATRSTAPYDDAAAIIIAQLPK